MLTQLPLSLLPPGAVEIAPGMGLVTGEEGGGLAVVHGLATFAWDAGDEAGRRLAAVQLVRLRAGCQAQVAQAFEVDPVTVWRWDQALSAGGWPGVRQTERLVLCGRGAACPRTPAGRVVCAPSFRDDGLQDVELCCPAAGEDRRHYPGISFAGEQGQLQASGALEPGLTDSHGVRPPRNDRGPGRRPARWSPLPRRRPRRQCGRVRQRPGEPLAARSGRPSTLSVESQSLFVVWRGHHEVQFRYPGPIGHRLRPKRCDSSQGLAAMPSGGGPVHRHRACEVHSDRLHGPSRHPGGRPAIPVPTGTWARRMPGSGRPAPWSGPSRRPCRSKPMRACLWRGLRPRSVTSSRAIAAQLPLPADVMGGGAHIARHPPSVTELPASSWRT